MSDKKGQGGAPSMPRSEPIAVVGLGLMGSRMAARLLAEGFTLRGYDPDADRMSEFESIGGSVAASPAEAAHGAWAALLSLPNSEVSRQVCLEAGGLIEAREGPLQVYDTTTGRPRDARAIATESASSGLVYSDATLSGNGQVAEQGNLVVMVGGTEESYRLGIPIFDAIGRSHHHVGPVGSGSRMKLIVNHVLAIHRMALAEALVVAEKSGVELEIALEILKDGLAYSKAMDVWGDRMITGYHEDPFSRIRQSLKDANLIVEHGEEEGAPMALVDLVRAALNEGEAAGLGGLDNSAIIEVVRRRAGIGRVD